MAITGTGTEQDPFIVHSYDELKYACEQHGNTYEKFYTKLANDINCNDYGEDWEWETITLGSNASGANKNNCVDLDGHTIKNVYIKNNNGLFTSNSTAAGDLKNGKILNVFGNSPSRILTKVSVDNISMSMQLGTPSATLFDSNIIINCAFYIVITSAGGRTIFYCVAGGIKNIDLYIELYNCGANTRIFHGSGHVNADLDSVRAVGTMKIPVGSDPPAPTDGIWTYGKATNSVFDIDMTDFNYAGISGNSKGIFGSAGDNTTVINWNKVPHESSADYTATGYLKATSTEEMKIGADLRSLGFLVVNVEE